MMSGIYKRIDEKFFEDEIYYGKILFNIINLLKNIERCLNCGDIVKSIGSNSRMKTAGILGKLAREELVYKILEKRTTYYGIVPIFDKQME